MMGSDDALHLGLALLYVQFRQTGKMSIAEQCPPGLACCYPSCTLLQADFCTGLLQLEAWAGSHKQFCKASCCPVYVSTN